MKSKLKKLCQIINETVFFGFIAAFAVTSVLLPKEEYSELENRYLSELPELDASGWFNGDIASGLASYADDHFPMRSNWISLHTSLEILEGKKRVNGVYIGDGRMMELAEPADLDRLDRSLEDIQYLCEIADAPVFVMIAPTAAQVYSDDIPDYENVLNQSELIDYVYERIDGEAVTVDVLPALEEAKDDYIYYRTDHHWTPQGAYVAYTEIAKMMGVVPAGLERFDIMHASHAFYGTLHSKTLYDGTEPDVVDFYISNDRSITLTAGEYVGSPYRTEYLQSKDKYLCYLGPNMPIVSLSSNAFGMKLLVIKDSYANCMLPFLSEHFSSVDAIDLRYMTDPDDYIEHDEYDVVLILYNADNFSADTNLDKLMLIDND